MIEEVTNELQKEAEKIFGDPADVVYDGIHQDFHAWSIHTRLFGVRVRFLMEISIDMLDNPYTINILVSQLPVQIMDRHEDDLLRSYEPYFAVDRAHTTGIIRHGEPYKTELWTRERSEDGTNVKIGKFVLDDRE